MEAMLVDCVRNSLSHFVYKNAIFMCERLCAEFPSEVNLQLLATSYLQNNQAYNAYHLLKGTQMAQSRYLFALSCYQMDLLNEAESALCPLNEPGAEIPNGAAGHYLLGLIYKYTDRRKNAAQQFKQSLTLDPLLWAAYEELCILGAAEEPSAVFGEAAALSIQKQYMQQLPSSLGLNTYNDERNTTSISGRLFSDSGPRRSSRLSADSGANTNASVATVSGNGNNTSKHLGGSKLGSLGLRSVTLRKGNSWANENMDEGVRGESFDDSRPNTASTTGSMASSDAKSCDQEDEIMSQKITIGISEILSLLRTLGEGCRLSYMYKCQEALDTYMNLPHKHYNTGWVLSQVGKAYFELIDYLEAEKAFRQARQASPYSLEGMDIYSTVLYHLKEDMKLSYLAQELISTDRLAPQSWCAMGNCYSLQKDHETALKNFLRAVQLNPRFAYAHTLCGHEYATLEDFENGMKSYQNALRVDTRHYNAWYGLGMIYLRQEKLEFSEHHFRMAFLINPSSSVIMSYLGTALHALKRSEEALEIMEQAILADRKNPLPMYQKANILVCLERLDEALEVLEELKEYAPSESSVYALMGRIYKRRNMHDKAMLHFGLALDMKPPATDVAAIKAAMEKLHVPDEIDESP
ncbi:hypothetical protein F2Q70_00029066 [Brassica cretica]|uniref:Cdc23 domain-containing protein n=1 Tax=Brassica cretica TaxID=69181 RepID=A0A8S9FGU4_BRACR|nr:hypothetical protein F2Q70_00029066 [Brassica cretica]